MRLVLLLASTLMTSAAFAQVSDVRPLVRGPQALSAAPEVVTDCRANIAKIVCLVDPRTDRHTPALERPCLPGSADYAKYFEAHYDRAIPLIQKMYCHLERLWVEKQFYATAYATPISDVEGGPMTGGAIGIRQEVLELSSTFDHWLTWKEETTFGGSLNSGDAPKGYLAYHSNKATPEMLLDYVINHEFGHLFDFANSYDKVQDCTVQKDPNGDWKMVGACTYAPDSFAAFSWIDARSGAKPADLFPDRGQICFYSCGTNTLNPQDTLKIFQGLYNTQFADTYASVDPMEDFAETFTQYIAFNKIGLEFNMETQGQTFDLKAHYFSPVMQPKRDYVEKVVLGTPKYPGEL